jgi:hypothetical protein
MQVRLIAHRCRFPVRPSTLVVSAALTVDRLLPLSEVRMPAGFRAERFDEMALAAVPALRVNWRLR